PKVINGASDFLVSVLGDAGRHARSAISAASLPLGVAVEIEAMFEIRP
ncbi:MAG: RidA family protein, partial [Rhodobacter sp.]